MNLKIEHQLKHARETANISRRDMAAHLHVARTTVAGWERGKHSPNLELLQQYAAKCNVTVAWIFGEVDDMFWRPAATTSGTPDAVHTMTAVA
jgi:DNA-binding XRE family transcriptional regulator